MYLNSFLFPAPRCSYSAEGLKDELIWIPKYQKKQNSFSRLHTTNDENTKNFHTENNITETPRNLIPQMKSKKQMPYSNKFPLSISDKVGQHKMLPKTPIINDQQCLNHPKKGSQKLLDIPEGSMPELSGIYDERPENKEIYIKELPPRLLQKQNPNKTKDAQTSYNVSVDDESNGVQVVGGKSNEKKFFLSGSNITNKIPKTTVSSRDSSLSTDVNSIPHARAKAPMLKKRSTKRLSQTFNCGDEIPEVDCDYDEGLVNEYPNQISSMTSPRNLMKYQTRLFSNPHSYSDKFPSARKVVTEYMDTAPDRVERSLTPLIEAKSKGYTRFSLAGPVKENVDYHIPCLILKSRFPNNKAIIYFHGNGEDINLARDLLTHVRDQLDITVIAVEYPGYGLYKGTSTEDQIQIDAEAVFDYLVSKVGLHPRNIILFGRSIGSGPATWLASRKNIGALVIMSAFTSIRAVVQHLAGKWAQYLIKERFNNLDHIARVTCPTFIVHGQKDRLIPYQHSQDLHSKCRGLSELVLPRDMDHIEFDFHDDFTAPLAEFLSRIRFGLELDKGLKVSYPTELFKVPKEPTPIIMSHRTPRY